MEKSHRANVIVTSCLKTPVDPHTKVPMALYERERSLPYAGEHLDNKDYEKEMEYDSGSDVGVGDSPGKGASPLLIKDYRVTGDHIDLREFYFSNEEYYRKLEQLKRAHLRTMAELELMYRKKLQLKSTVPVDSTERANRLQWGRTSPRLVGSLKKSFSAYELRRGPGLSDESDDECHTEDVSGDGFIEKGLLLSPKEHIKNMWQGFSVDKLSPRQRQRSSSSLHSRSSNRQGAVRPKGKGKGHRSRKLRAAEEENEGQAGLRPRTTVPKPFRMMLREAERKRKGVKTRAEIEQENAELRQQLEELMECQRKFRATPMPAHARLPLYEELREREEERRRLQRQNEQQRLHSSQRPFSFLERERLKKEQKEEQLREQMLQLSKEEEERRRRPFKAKPVPRAVREAATGELQKEEELYRAIKMQMRAKELLHGASMPPSMLARRLSERRAQKEDQEREEKDDGASHRPKINAEVPDFDASYRRYRKQLESHRDVRPATVCEPFKLRTANIASHRERIMADIEADRLSPRASRWPFSTPAATSSPRTPSSSLCSSLSGSQEYLPAKITDAARKRQEAVRKVLEQRKRAEEDEERWRERQKQREQQLQRVITKRAQANDPHLPLAQTCQSKLKQFRKQDKQRRREYREEMREIQERVKSRPLLLEQVAQLNAKQAAEKRYADTLHECGLTEAFVSGKAPKSQSQSPQSPNRALTSSLTFIKLSEDDKDSSLADARDINEPFSDDYPDDYEEYDQDTEARETEKEDKDQSDEKEDGRNSESDHSEHEKAEDDCRSRDADSYSDEDHRGNDSDEESDIINRGGSSHSNRSSRSSHSRHSNKSLDANEGGQNSVGSLSDSKSEGEPS
ncbi:protein FAM161A [Chanos chanos]|uniref:Protein FAM161A n=1 Tax=Chanos chanos TaxID=29144 RepID=A0A6J2VRW1_CHACN|nr:protein FAM161A [Chanos chanos]